MNPIGPIIYITSAAVRADLIGVAGAARVVVSIHQQHLLSSSYFNDVSTADDVSPVYF